MVKFCSLLLVIAMFVLPLAAAEGFPDSAWVLLPADAVLQSAQQDGEIQLYTVLLPQTGEELLLTHTDGSDILLAKTIREAECDENAPVVERSRAEELVQKAYPGCRVLFARDEDAGKLLGVAGDDFCGSIVVADDRIRSRNLETGEIFRDGILTLDGARKVMRLHRPEAEIGEMELDEDDGVYEYEGEARSSGEEYEFELSASTGKLLEWERD